MGAIGLIDRERVKSDTVYREGLRLQCQTDLLFLARVLGYDKFVEEVHRENANLCLRKNPALPIEQQDTLKERMNLDPRGTFKSTLAIVDDVQFIICFPNVRIGKLTATKPLAKAIANEIRDHFVQPANGEPSDFQLLFPEYVIKERDAVDGMYTAPCRNVPVSWKEATVMSFSIETTIGGWHFDVFDVDDVVVPENSKTPSSIRTVIKNYRVNKKTAMPWAYINIRGTRHNPFDLYGDIIEKAKPGKTKLLVRSVLKLKNGGRLEPGEFPPADEMTLLFPQLLNYEFLKKEFEDDYESFMTQYMNDAAGGNEVVFPKEMMLQATLPASDVPASGEVFIAWRLPYAAKPQMKHAAAAVGIMESGRLYIVDAVEGSFKPSTLAHHVVRLAKKYGVHQITVEDTPGARHYEASIQNYALALGWKISVNWIEYEEDDGVRELRMKATEPVIVARRLLFSETTSRIMELYRQFCNFGMVEENGMPDVVARVAEHLPKTIAPIEQDQEQDLNWELAKQRDAYDKQYGLGKYAPQMPVQEEPYKAPTNNYGLDDVLGGLNG